MHSAMLQKGGFHAKVNHQLVDFECNFCALYPPPLHMQQAGKYWIAHVCFLMSVSVLGSNQAIEIERTRDIGAKKNDIKRNMCS